ncbi:hypothetical protein MMC34_001576 [Xylographa carneopallida]|nr:hypothetical protein [Xylographa carneopallida]
MSTSSNIFKLKYYRSELTVFGPPNHPLKTIRAGLEELTARETQLIPQLRTAKRLSRDSISTSNDLESLLDIDALFRSILIRDETRKCNLLKKHVTILKRDLKGLQEDRARLQVRESMMPAMPAVKGIMADVYQSCWWERKSNQKLEIDAVLLRNEDSAW